MKIRISNSKLLIEEGRFKKLPVNERLCPLCNLEVETEKHFVVKCEKLNCIRHDIFSKIQDIVPSFNDMNDEDKFYFIMSNSEYDIIKICI